MFDTLALKAQSEFSSFMSGGKAFQSMTVLGKKDIFFLSVLQPKVWNLFLVFLFGEINLLYCLMATSLLSTLYSMQRRASCLLSCRDRLFRPWSMSLTLDLFRCLLVTKRAACRCTISSFWICLWVCGYHTVLSYSTRGLTRVKYACCLMETEPTLRFLRRKPRVLLAFAHVSLMWVSHFRYSVMITPRYLANVTLASVWSCSFYSVCRGFLLPVTVITLHLVAWNPRIPWW